MPTEIQWTDETWNPTTGCTKISPGCAKCYIERTPAFRIAGRKFEKGATDFRLHPDRLEKPLHWKKPRRVFVNSLSDLFHESVPDAFRDFVWAVMMLSPRHTFQILTKRPEAMRAYLRAPDLYDRVLRAAGEYRAKRPELTSIGISDPARHPARWIWLGVSCENQHWFDVRVPILRDTPAAVRFLSCEPLLGDIDPYVDTEVGVLNALLPYEESPGIDWVIVGGESGDDARPCSLKAVRRLVKACELSSVPVFVKQLGAWPYDRWPDAAPLPLRLRMKSGRKVHPFLNLRDSKGGDITEWPGDVRIREFPERASRHA